MNLIILQDAIQGTNNTGGILSFWLILNYIIYFAGVVLFILLYLRVMKYLKKRMAYMDHKMRSGQN